MTGSIIHTVIWINHKVFPFNRKVFWFNREVFWFNRTVFWFDREDKSLRVATISLQNAIKPSCHPLKASKYADDGGTAATDQNESPPVVSSLPPSVGDEVTRL